MVEASLHSKHGLGVMGNHEEETEDGLDTNQGPMATARPTSGSLQASAVDVKAFCPLNILCLLDFVGRQQVFSEQPSLSSIDIRNGTHHVAFLVEGALIAWAKETLAAAAILQDAHSARQSHGRFTRDNRNLALAILDLPSLGRQSVKFIHWQIPGRTGRPVELDLQNRVKALVCVGALKEALKLENCIVIHPDSGVPMLRARGYKLQERPQMLSSMCRLRTMCEMALQCQMSDADVDADVEEEGDETPATVCLSSGSQCLFCSRRAASLPFPEKLGTGNTSQCPCCLQKLGRCVTYFFVPFMSVPQWCNWFGMDLAWQLCQQPAHTQGIGMHHAMTCFQFASRQWMPAISAHGSKYLKYLPAGCSPSFPTPGYLNY